MEVIRILLGCIGACAIAHAPHAATPYEWKLPTGFPPPDVPADNSMSEIKIDLGKRLFFDTRLSINGRIACASCHRPELAFTDGRPLSIGAAGEPTRRNAMSLVNVAYNVSFTWASLATRTLENQMRTPLFGTHPIEMGLRDDDPRLIDELSRDPAYLRDFERAFPGETRPLSFENIVKAIAAFERTLIFGRSAFDRYVFDDEREALSDSARRGMALFFSERARCSHCHSGLNFAGPMRYAGSPQVASQFADNGIGRAPTATAAADAGLFAETKRKKDMGLFRVPTLRNIALTAPYMHDGRFQTLEEVLDHYAGTHKQSTGAPLSGHERADLLDFLRSLTDEAFAKPGDRLDCYGVEPC